MNVSAQPTTTTTSGTSPMGSMGGQPTMTTSSQYTTPQAAADIAMGAAQKTAESKTDTRNETD